MQVSVCEVVLLAGGEQVRQGAWLTLQDGGAQPDRLRLPGAVAPRRGPRRKLGARRLEGDARPWGDGAKAHIQRHRYGAEKRGPLLLDGDGVAPREDLAASFHVDQYVLKGAGRAAPRRRA